jgi:hypothetical protein
MSITIVSLAETAKSGSISVKPFFDPNKSNLGLEKYGLALFDGVFHEEQLACIERNGIKRYLTGLNEFAPEVKLIPEKEAREAKILDIRATVAQLEKDLASNIIDPGDKDFWNKVTLLQPNNDDFWSKIIIRCGNQPVILDPTKDPYDLIKLIAIDAGGFSIVAKSYEDARSRAVPPKFYLDKYVDTVSTKTEVSKLRNRALSELVKLFDKNQNKLFYVCKVVDGNSVQYKKTTPNDVMYDNMDKFITGQGVETNLKRAAQSFIDVCALDAETLKIKALVKDATFYKFLNPKADGFIYHTDTNSMLGRNVADCIDYLKNPLNDSILLDITKKVEKNWNV